LIGLTGPSAFSQQCMEVVEEFLEANFVLLYHGSEDNTNFWLDHVDGVVLSGGIDIHPTLYSQSVWSNNNLSKFDMKRDLRELQIIEYCLKNGKPMLGICRGHQLIGVRHGLGFIMDLSSSPICHQPLKHGISTDPSEPMHSIKIIQPQIFYGEYKMPQEVVERRVLKQMLGEKNTDRIWVNSFHHQGLAYAKTNNVEVIGTARVELDGCKEIVELMQGETWLSCQWHPEYDWKENTASRVVLERFKTLVNK
jgi:putative glutamine amidotransferase